MINKKAVFWNTAIQVTVRFITLAFTLVSIKLLTNYLGKEGFGNYNTITTYLNFFIVIADLGFFSVAVGEIAKNPENEKKIMSNVFFIRLISALIASTAAIAIIFFTPYRNNPNLFFGIIIGCGFLFFNLLASVYDMILQYRLKMQFSALAEFLSKLIALASLFLIIKLHGNFLIVTTTIALSGILIFLFKWLFSRQFLRFGFEYDRKISGWIFNLAWPMGVVFIMNNLFFHLDSLMLYVIKGPAPTGIYSVAYKILDVTVFIGAYFSSALKPAMAQHIDENKMDLCNLVEKSIVVMLFVSAPIAVVCLAFSKDIIVFLSNSSFVAGSSALIILSLVLPFAYLDVLLSEIMIAGDKRKTLVGIAAFILVFNFLFNLVFIPKFSFMAAAIGTLVSEIILFMINFYFTRRIIPYKINWEMVGKIIVISSTTLILTMLVSKSGFYFIFNIFFSILIYFILAFMFGIFSKQTFKELLKRES